jgi:hypothetical protein
MRIVAPICALIFAAALAAPAGALSTDVDNGIVVFKTLPRGVEVAQVVSAPAARTLQAAPGRGRASLGPCADPRFRPAGGRWRSMPTFYVNMASLQNIAGSATTTLPAGEVLSDLLTGSRAWNAPFVTDCTNRPVGSRFYSRYGGPTDLHASLADGATMDGTNVVEFRSLVGTICDGAIACTILNIEGRRITEADIMFEKDITRLSGFADYWTTSDLTTIWPTTAQFAVIDVATHEWGHVLGLDNVNSPSELTMVGPIHDGMQTIGLGDMLGALILYR